jgi:hypothetical protein
VLRARQRDVDSITGRLARRRRQRVREAVRDAAEQRPDRHAASVREDRRADRAGLRRPARIAPACAALAACLRAPAGAGGHRRAA